MVLLPQFNSDAFQAPKPYEVRRSSIVVCHYERLQDKFWKANREVNHHLPEQQI